jgi:glycosyltransferase involved in cell wall biosynthesis
LNNILTEIPLNNRKINVLQFLCPVGFYGVERWVLALINNSNTNLIRHDLAVTEESDLQDLEILNQFSLSDGKSHRVKMKARFDFFAIYKLVKIIRERRIDIIHTHGYKSDILGLMAAKITGIKSVTTPHGFGQPSDFKLGLFIKFGTVALKYFDKVAPLSKQLENEVTEFRVPLDKICYIQNGVDLMEVQKYLSSGAGTQKNEKKRIGFIGQMIPRKNIEVILDAFEAVHNKLPNTELYLLGDGGNRKELMDYSQSLSSVSNIHFLGFRNDRLQLLKSFDLFVMTSKDEGIPRCLMEAMGMGVPVVAYNIKGIDQLIKHEETGLLADFGDFDSLTEYWLEMITNESLARRLADRGQGFVNEEFSGKRMAIQYQSLFKSMVNF